MTLRSRRWLAGGVARVSFVMSGCPRHFTLGQGARRPPGRRRRMAQLAHCSGRSHRSRRGPRHRLATADRHRSRGTHRVVRIRRRAVQVAIRRQMATPIRSSSRTRLRVSGQRRLPNASPTLGTVPPEFPKLASRRYCPGSLPQSGAVAAERRCATSALQPDADFGPFTSSTRRCRLEPAGRSD